MMPQDQALFENSNVHVSDLVSSDMYIDKSGAVIGTFYYVTGFEAFSSNPDEQSGNYCPIQLGKKYEGRTVTVRRNGAVVKSAADTSWIIRIKNREDTYTFEVAPAAEPVRSISAISEDNVERILTVNFSKATFDNEVTKARVMDRNKQIPDYGTKKASELMADDVHIEWLDGDVIGVVKGTLHHIENWSELPKEPKSGHFFAMTIDNYYLNKPFTFYKDGVQAGYVDKATQDEMFWVLNVDQTKVFTFMSGDTTIATLNFAGVGLEPPVAQKAIKALDGEGVTFTEWGKKENFLTNDVKVTWNNKEDAKKASITGIIKYYSGNDHVKPGNCFPIILDDYFKDKTVLLNGKEVSCEEGEVVYNFGNYPVTTRTITVTSGGFEVATFDFNGATFLPGGGDAVEIPNYDYDMDAVKQAGILIDDNVYIDWDGAVGYVHGTIKPYCFIEEGHFDSDPVGHFMPIVLKQEYNEKAITGTGSSGNEATLTDLKWIIRVDGYLDKNSRAKLKFDNNVIAELDFTKAYLAPAKGVNCFSPMREGKTFPKTFGESRQFTDFCGKDFKIEWISGIGWVSGALKKLPDAESGNWYMPIRVLEMYGDKDLKAKITKGDQDPAITLHHDKADKRIWYLKLGNDDVKAKARTIDITCGDQLLGTLKFVSLGVGPYTGPFKK